MSDRVLEMDLFNGEPEKSINVEGNNSFMYSCIHY